MAEQYGSNRDGNSNAPRSNDRPYGERPPTNDRKPASDRPARTGGDRPYGDRDNRGGQGARPSRDRSFGERENRSADRPLVNGRREDRKPAADRGYGDRDNRGGYGDRPARSGGDRPYGDRPARPAGDRDNNRGGYGDRPARSGGDRPYGDRPARPAGDRDNNRGPRVAPERNAGDLRSSNRPDRDRSPEIDPDVTGEELDKVTRAQLRILDSRNNEWVSKHLVMAGRLIDFDADLAFQHALAASRRGGRLACVREAVAMTAYAAGNYAEALRELRTYRRISGSNAHLPLMADCERGLGRPDRALDLIQSEDASALDMAGKIELAIVESGARGDMGDLEAALSALELPQLDINRAFSFSPRLFRAYAMVLRALDRKTEAKTWERQALVADEALGIDDSTDSIIVDLGDDDDDLGVELKPRTRVADVMEPATAPSLAEDTTVVNEHAEHVADDAESGDFDSDDAESDENSVDDELDRAEMGGSGDDELDELLDGDTHGDESATRQD